MSDNNLPMREVVLEIIANALSRAHDLPSGELYDYPHEATLLLEEIEARAVALHRDGYLVFGEQASPASYTSGDEWFADKCRQASANLQR